MTFLDRILGRIECVTPEPPPGYDKELAELRHGVSRAALGVVAASAATARAAYANARPEQPAAAGQTG